jgi:hypothetical protein
MQEDDYTSGGLLSTAVWEKQGVISSANGGDMDSWSPTLDTMKPCQGWGTRHTATFISPVPKSEGVKFHDMLYSLSPDILYSFPMAG